LVVQKLRVDIEHRCRRRFKRATYGEDSRVAARDCAGGGCRGWVSERKERKSAGPGMMGHHCVSPFVQPVSADHNVLMPGTLRAGPRIEAGQSKIQAKPRY
jgi:hypothetical protein